MGDVTRPSRRQILGWGVAGTIAVATAGCSTQRGSSPDTALEPDDADWGGTHLDPPFDKPAVNFTRSSDGSPFSLVDDTAGQLTLLFFGYTSCPDVCPVYLNTIAASVRAIGSGPGSRPTVLFVGVDVARDTAEVVEQYVSSIDETFVGLTATEDQIATALDALSMPPVVIAEPDADGSYEVGHPAQVTVFSPDDAGHRIYPYNTRQQQWVADLPRLAQGQYQ